MSPLELVESLQKYPVDENPETHESIKAEIESRKKQLDNKAKTGVLNGAGKEYLVSWKKRRLIGTGITLALSLMFGWQILSGLRDPVQASAILGVVLTSYIYSTLRIEFLLKDQKTLESLETAQTNDEVKCITKSSVLQKVIVTCAYVGLGALYVFA